MPAISNCVWVCEAGNPPGSMKGPWSMKEPCAQRCGYLGIQTHLWGLGLSCSHLTSKTLSSSVPCPLGSVWGLSQLSSIPLPLPRTLSDSAGLCKPSWYPPLRPVGSLSGFAEVLVLPDSLWQAGPFRNPFWEAMLRWQRAGRGGKTAHLSERGVWWWGGWCLKCEQRENKAGVARTGWFPSRRKWQTSCTVIMSVPGAKGQRSSFGLPRRILRDEGLLFYFETVVSLYRPGWPRTHRKPTATASQVLGLKCVSSGLARQDILKRKLSSYKSLCLNKTKQTRKISSSLKSHLTSKSQKTWSINPKAADGKKQQHRPGMNKTE